jgi:hypothetical protein
MSGKIEISKTSVDSRIVILAHEVMMTGAELHSHRYLVNEIADLAEIRQDGNERPEVGEAIEHLRAAVKLLEGRA